MVSSPFGLGFANLLLVLIPGYLGLKGYLAARLTVDSLSRIDKILVTIVAGVLTGVLLLLLIQLTALFGIADSVASITLQDTVTIPIFTLSKALIAQSLLGIFGGYVIGTVQYVFADESRSVDKNVKQPWETAVRRATLGDRVEIITQNGKRIVGKLHRIGSPSKNKDILLESAKEIVNQDGDDKERRPLGYSYHEYNNISQINFPKIEPTERSHENNVILRILEVYIKIRRKIRRIIINYRHGYTHPRHKLRMANRDGQSLKERIENE